MRVLLCSWSIAVLSSLFSSVANPRVNLRLHGIRNSARCCSITRTLFYFWSCEFLQISDAWFQSFYRRLLTSTRITTTVLTPWACRVMFGVGWARSVVCMSSGNPCSISIANTCCWLRVKVSWEAGCVIVLLCSNWQWCWWKIFWPLVQVIWIWIVHFLSFLNSNYNYKVKRLFVYLLKLKELSSAVMA